MSEDLSPSVTLTREQQEQRRLAAAQDLLEGEMTQAEIAEKHGVTPSAVSKWRSTLEEDGIEALESTNEEGNQGPNSELDDQHREQLVELLEEGAQTHGWETDLWTAAFRHRLRQVRSSQSRTAVFSSCSTSASPRIHVSEAVNRRAL